MTANCDCPIVGYCARHKMEKTSHLFSLCKTREDYRRLWDSLAAGQPIAAPTVIHQVPAQDGPVRISIGGVGTELHALLAEVGVTPSLDCPCNRRMHEMDANGIRWCQENVTTIATWLREAAVERSWGETIKAATKLGARLPFRINPLAPYRSLVEEAIRRAQYASIEAT